MDISLKGFLTYIFGNIVLLAIYFYLISTSSFPIYLIYISPLGFMITTYFYYLRGYKFYYKFVLPFIIICLAIYIQSYSLLIFPFIDYSYSINNVIDTIWKNAYIFFPLLFNAFIFGFYIDYKQNRKANNKTNSIFQRINSLKNNE